MPIYVKATSIPLFKSDLSFCEFKSILAKDFLSILCANVFTLFQANEVIVFLKD